MLDNILRIYRNLNSRGRRNSLQDTRREQRREEDDLQIIEP
jgi:hypothetical protein